MSGNSASSRWTKQHGYGFRSYRGVQDRRWRRLMRKKAWPTEVAARDQALLMDLKHGEPFNAYPCRWGEDYRAGETAPLHWHVGHEPEKRLTPLDNLTSLRLD